MHFKIISRVPGYTKAKRDFHAVRVAFEQRGFCGESPSFSDQSATTAVCVRLCVCVCVCVYVCVCIFSFKLVRKSMHQIIVLRKYGQRPTDLTMKSCNKA